MARVILILVSIVLAKCVLLESAAVSVENESPEDVNVVEIPYADIAASNIEGSDGEEVTDGTPLDEEEANNNEEATTQRFLPEHLPLAESDKHSVPPAKGKETKIGNLTVYESPSKSGAKSLIITVFDLFGFHPHVKYIADKLSKSTGSYVVIPDLFHGNPVDVKTFPQPDFQERASHIFDKNGMWVNTKTDLLETIKYYKEHHKVHSIGIYGFCWGGKMIVYASTDPDFKNLTSFALVHPSRVENEEAKDINIPGLLLPSSAEPDMIPFLETLNKNNGANTSEHYRFDDMNHGFAGARSDFSDPKVRSRVEEVIQKLSSFFIKTFHKSS